ncbi:MAG: peptidylprolyl isomerase [Acidobacteria bacterium]|nr:peptidylprolyl isomerase [Acidobacteriota bacterium]
MFNLFRSQKKVVKYLLGSILSITALSMVITLIPGLMNNPDTTGDVALGEVDGRPITAQIVATHMRSQGVPSDLPLNSVILSSASAVNALVEREVLLMEAEKLGLFPDDQEVADWLKFQMPMLFPDGVFVGSATYARYVRETFRLSVPEFERQLAVSLAVDTRLRRLVTSNIVVPNSELLKDYKNRNQEAKIEFIKVAPEDFTSQVEISEEELRARFEQEKARHRIPEERTVKVLTVDDSGLPEPEIPETRLRQYYSSNRAVYHMPEQARASHILFTLEPGQEENPEKEAKAKEVLKKIRDGADFAAMAKEFSEDVANAGSGGDLGFFNQGEFPEAFEKATFALEPGAISEVVKSVAGYHIIKLQEHEAGRTQPFEEVRAQIQGTLRTETYQTARVKVIDEITAAAREAGEDLESVGRKYNFEVKTFGPFNVNDPPPQIAGDQVFVNTLFTSEPGTPATSNQEGVTKIGIVTSLEPMRLAEFEEVRATVRESLLEEKTQGLAQKRAEQIAEAAQQPGATLRQIASRFGSRVRSSNLFKTTDMIDDLGRAAELGPDPFEGDLNVVVGPRKVGDNFAIFQAVERKEADMGRFEDQRENIRRTRLDMRVNAEFRVYAEGKVAEYEAAGRVHKYDTRVREFAATYTRSRS